MGRSLTSCLTPLKSKSLRGESVTIIGSFALLTGAMFSVGCASTPAQSPVYVAPTPTSVTRTEPGGDATSPEVAAFHRLLNEPWGFREDKKQSLLVAIPDWGNWKRSKFSNPIATPFVGFKYGDKLHAMSGVFVRDSAKPEPSSEECLRDFEKWAFAKVMSLGAEMKTPKTSTADWNGKSIMIRSTESSISWGLGTKRYAATYASYPTWPSTCVTVGYAVPMNEDAELAIQVRDRFEKEAFGKFKTKTAVKPEIPPP